MLIGFAGHRPNRQHLVASLVRQRLDGALDTIRRVVSQRGRPTELVAVSGLAEGSDRLFAEAALALGYALWALLPFKSPTYERTFSDPTKAVEFHSLLRRAARITELDGQLSDTKAAYEALGHELVGGCNLIVAVWDGEPAAGRGGTAFVIDAALQKSVPVVWVSAVEDQPLMLLRAMYPRIQAEPFDLELASRMLG